MQRYFCEVLKEHGGEDRFTITGVRWAEGTRRKKNRNGAEILPADIKKKIILNADNDFSRRVLENCELKGKRVINPIIDWTDADVWEFLRHYGCQSNPLYQCGYKRVGCVGCPMSRRQEWEFKRYPKYKQNYIRAFQRMVDTYGYADTSEHWKDGQSTYNWWIAKKAGLPKEIENQIEMEAAQ
jgi:phosphoadenosine phosphosulfate reductase